jgi:hypothetical protein
MTSCLGAQPHRAPPPIEHRIARLGCVLAFTLLAANAAAGVTDPSEPARQRVAMVGDAHPNELTLCSFG